MSDVVGGRSRNWWETVGKADFLLPFITGEIVFSCGGSCVAGPQSLFYQGEWASSTNDFILLKGIITLFDMAILWGEIRSGSL